MSVNPETFPTMATANGAPADPMSGHALHDREIDDAPSPRVSARTRVVHQSYQRLIANPFMAMLAIIAWFAAVRQTVLMKRLDLFGLAVLSLGLVVFLFQYHCLDCGATGRLMRWREHACEAVRRRSQTGQMPRYHLITPVAQTLAWFYLLILVVLAVAILKHR